jgi:hypothetical protein
MPSFKFFRVSEGVKVDPARKENLYREKSSDRLHQYFFISSSISAAPNVLSQLQLAKSGNPTGETTGPCYKLPLQILNMHKKTYIEIVLQGVFSSVATAGGALDFPQYTVYPYRWFDPRTLAEFAVTVGAANSHKIAPVPQSYFTILLNPPKSLHPPPPPYF